MRWLVAGLLFALAVGLAIGTAAIRADNTRTRRRIEVSYHQIEDRTVELKRLSMARLEASAPQRLAAAHWQWLRNEALRRQHQLEEQLQ